MITIVKLAKPMDDIFDFFTSETFIIVFPIVIGILASWYISKHFFNKKKLSALQLAKKYKKANFGDFYNISQEKTIRKINTQFFGTWHIKSDGTVSDTENYLCWIRAPYGTIWDGENFNGKPIGMSWTEASTLFGKGVYVEHYKNHKETHEINITKENYKKGNCTVSFANSDSWRLPTASEFENLHYKSVTDLDISKEYTADLLALKTELFPGFKANSKNYNVWSADEAGSNCAWISNELYCLSDEQISNDYYVLFVRTMNTYEVENERKMLDNK